MVSILNSILVGLFSIALLFLLYFTYLFFRLNRDRLYLAGTTISLGAVLYIACNVALYNSATVEQYVSIVSVQKYGTFLYHIGMLWFALRFSGLSIRYLYPVAAFLGIFLVAREIDPGIIYSGVRGIATHQLPWGERLSVLDADSGVWVYVYEAGYVYIYGMIIACAVKLAHALRNIKGRMFLAGSVMLSIIAVYDIAVFNMNLRWPFLGEAGFVAMIMMLGFIISNDVIKAGLMSQKIADNERKLKAIFNSTFQTIGIIGTDGRLLEVNDAYMSFTGVPREQIIGERIYNNRFLGLVDDDWDAIEASFRRAAGGRFARGISRMRDAGGTVHFVDYSFKPVIDDAGIVSMVIVEGRDITDLKKAEARMMQNAQELSAANEELVAANEELESTNEFIEAQNRELIETQKSLKEREQYNRLLFSESYVPKIVLDPRTGMVTDCNAAAVRIFGYGTREELIGKTPSEVSPPGQQDGVASVDAARTRVIDALEKGNIIFEWKLRRPSGEIWDAEVHLMTFRDRGKKLMQLTLEDVTKKKAIETALRNSEERFRISAEKTGILFYDYDIPSGVIIWSGAIEKITGFSVDELRQGGVGRWEELLHEEDRPHALKKLQKAIDTVSTYDVEYRFLRKDGTYIVLSDHGVVLPGEDSRGKRMLGLMSDITEKKEAQAERDRFQAQLIQAQKMEAIGTLASGLAHDFNNMLAGIMGSLSLLKILLAKERLTQPDAVEDCIKTGTDSSRRAADMVKHLLTISQKREIQPAVVNVATSLANIQKICKNSFPKSIILDFEIPGGAFLTFADPVELEQVFLNLCVNASHAMTIMRPGWQKEGGTLRVVLADSSGNGYAPPSDPAAVKGNDYIQVTISDTGVGMDAATQKRIFEPFFTTKGREIGSGLGLSIVYGIVQRHGGFLKLESEPGRGTTFTVHLPAHGDAGAREVHRVREDHLPRGHGKILIVDDEDAIIKVATGILTACGYQVVSRTRGDEAISLYRSEHDGITAVLLDMSMPGMSGIEILRELRAINPDARILLSSGFAEDERVRAARSMGISGFIQKPYTADELSRVVHRVISG